MSPRSGSYAALRRWSMNTYAPPAATAPTMTSGGISQARSVPSRLRIGRRFDEIAQASDRPDHDPRGFELRAQPRDVHLDRVGGDVLVPGGDRAGDLVLADDGAHVREQVFEDRVFALRQLEGLAV